MFACWPGKGKGRGRPSGRLNQADSKPLACSARLRLRSGSKREGGRDGFSSHPTCMVGWILLGQLIYTGRPYGGYCVAESATCPGLPSLRKTGRRVVSACLASCRLPGTAPCLAAIGTLARPSACQAYSQAALLYRCPGRSPVMGLRGHVPIGLHPFLPTRTGGWARHRLGEMSSAPGLLPCWALVTTPTSHVSFSFFFSSSSSSALSTCAVLCLY